MQLRFEATTVLDTHTHTRKSTDSRPFDGKKAQPFTVFLKSFSYVMIELREQLMLLDHRKCQKLSPLFRAKNGGRKRGKKDLTGSSFSPLPHIGVPFLSCLARFPTHPFFANYFFHDTSPQHHRRHSFFCLAVMVTSAERRMKNKLGTMISPHFLLRKCT